MATGLEKLLGIDPPSNPEIVGVPFVALQKAQESRTARGDAHVIDALLRIGSVADAFAAIAADARRARENVARIIDALPRVGTGGRFMAVLRVSRDVVDPLYRARAHARAAGLKELTAPLALAVLVASPDARHLLGALEEAGFSLLRYRWYVAHRLAADPPCPDVGPVRVTFHDDPFTPMEFVVSVLVEVFGRDPSSAEALMRRVHEEGSAMLATMDAPVAARALTELRSRADAQGWPLRVSVAKA